MWESTLKKLKADTAKRAILKWCNNPKHITLIANAINCVYRFECNDKGYYLKVTHEKIRNLTALRSALDFQQYLCGKNVPICKPVNSQNDTMVETVEQNDLAFLAHVCEEVPGSEIHFNYKNLEIYSKWGKALAYLHEASSNYSPSPDLSFYPGKI